MFTSCTGKFTTFVTRADSAPYTPPLWEAGNTYLSVSCFNRYETMFKDILLHVTDRNSPVSNFSYDQLNNRVFLAGLTGTIIYRCGMYTQYIHMYHNSANWWVAKTETSYTQCVMKLKPCSSIQTQITAIINKDWIPYQPSLPGSPVTSQTWIHPGHTTKQGSLYLDAYKTAPNYPLIY